MIEATKYLRWDGVCRADAKGKPGSCNANGGAPKPTAEDSAPLQAHPSSELGRGVVASIMRFEVHIVRVAPRFWPGQEYVAIRVRFKAIDDVTSLVLQVRDTTGKLVYAEKLPAAQVWGLPDAFDASAKPAAPGSGDADKLANAEGYPYKVTVLIAKEGAEIALDLDDFSRPPANVARNPDAAVPLDGAMASDRTRPRILELAGVDHHFAPSRTLAGERLQIRSRVSGLSDLTVNVRVTSAHYPHGGGVVYEAPLADVTDGEHTDLWNGLSTAGAGPLANKLINPLFSPYEVQLVVTGGAAESAKKPVEVLYRGLSLEKGSYLEDPGTPPVAGATALYAQYMLNELGYFAGPVTAALSAQGKRALRRYTYGAPNYLESERLTETSVDVTATPVTTAMTNGVKRRQIFSDDRCLADPAVPSRLYIDHNYFYRTLGEFGDAQGHSKKAAAKLDRFEVPIRAKVYLVSRSDADGSGAGVEAGEAAGDIDIEWTIIDPPEDLSSCPVASTDSPSRTREYLEKVLAAKAASPGDPDDPGDNCPAADNRGVRGVADHFLAGADLPPFTTRVAGSRVLTQVHQDDGTHPHQVGCATVLFRGSHIAGDNYVVEASICWETHARAKALEQAHGRALGMNYEQKRRRRTGKMTIWRRYTVKAVVDWPAPSNASIWWADVRDVYARAHIELDASRCTTTDMATIMNGGAGRALNDMAMMIAYQSDHIGVAPIAHDDQCVYSGPPLPAQNAGEDGEKYKARIDAALEDYLTTDHLGNVASLIRTAVLANEEAGQITMRVNWCRPVTVNHYNFLGRLSRTEQYEPKLFCIGLAEGVIMLPNSYLRELDSHFVVAHEIGHCLFLRHHETTIWVPAKAPKTGKVRSDTPNYDNRSDHDLEDHNCTMCYPWGVVTRNPPKTKEALSWNRGTRKKPYFCGKCVLKLRGWDVTGGANLPDDSA